MTNTPTHGHRRLTQTAAAVAAWTLTAWAAGLSVEVVAIGGSLVLSAAAVVAALHSLWTDPQWDEHRPSMLDTDWDAFEQAARAEMDEWPCTCTHTAGDHHHGTTPCIHCECAIFEGVADDD